MTQQLAQWLCFGFLFMSLAMHLLFMVHETAKGKAESAVFSGVVLMLWCIFGLLLRAAGTFTMIF